MGILEQDLLDYLKKHPNIDLKELKRGIRISDENDELLEKSIYDLECKGLIYQNKNSTYCLIENKPSICCGKAHFLLSGDMVVTNNNGEKVIVPQDKTDGILEKDIVCVQRKLVDNKGNIYGQLDKIVKRKNEQISCEVVFNNGENTLIPYNTRCKSKVRVNQKELDKHGVGEILLVRLTTISSQLDGNIVKSIGHKDEPDVDEKTIAYDHGFEVKFSNKTIKELEKIPTTVDIKKAFLEGRRDLRSKNIFTIDGSDTKDIDDSIGIELLPNGNYKLYVNIADVSYYVKENTSLNNDAYERATSVYMNDTVIPMLPPKLSNGICSLHPNVDRLTKTCEMIINQDGEIVDYDIYDSIINSRKKMTYEDVNKILIDNEGVSGYEDFYEDLKLMNQLSKKLNIIKDNRGYINFSRDDIKAKGKGLSAKFEKRKQQDAEKLIENFMLLANETVAQYIFYRGLPFLYRIHEVPEETKLEEFLSILENLGYEIKKCKSITENKYIQNIIKMLCENEENSKILTELLLINTMKKARYSNMNYGHYGLALKCYTHFTSPIRRYPDLQVHRLLNLYDKVYDFDYNELNKYLKEIANHCTERSYEADKAERDAMEMRMAEFLQNNIGNCFDGIITEISSHQVKVKTNEGFSGTINVDDLGDESFSFIPIQNKLIGKVTGTTYTIGSPLKIKVKEANKKARTVKFTTEYEPIKKKTQKRRHK